MRGMICLVAAAAVCGGCGGDLAPECPLGGCGTQVTVKGYFQFDINRKVDLLFVVDDTPAIAPYAETLAAGLAEMGLDLVGASPQLSLHVGFVRAGSCDTSTRGSACGVTAPEQFLRSEWCNTMTNDSRAFADAFACLGAFGVADCGPPQPLAAALRTLSGPPGAGWEGFLRPEAYLMIVVVTASDDASGLPAAPTPVLDLAAALRAVKADPSQILVSVIGPGNCQAGETAAPRLAQLTGEFGASGRYLGLCGSDLGAALDPVTAYAGVGHLLCLSNVRDTDTVTPGLQPSCTVVAHDLTPNGSIVDQSIPSCQMGPPPCWGSVQPGLCESGQPGCAFNIEEATDWCYESGERFTIECLSCADASDPACAQAR